MENLLFSDLPQQDAEFKKGIMTSRILFLVLCGAFVLLGVLGLILENIAPEDRSFLLFVSVVGIVLWFSLFISCLCMERQYLLVFDDAIRYKKGLLGKEKQLIIAPNQYKIKLRKFTTRGGYTFWILFYNQKGKRILSYKLCQSFTSKRKYDLSHIGCEIIDRRKVLNQR